MQMAEQGTLPLIMRDDYDLEGFLKQVAAEPDKRCSYCYASRLLAAAEAAAKGGFEAFTASLLYSRYQKHDEIRALGEQIGSELGVAFYYQDFRSGRNPAFKGKRALPPAVLRLHLQREGTLPARGPTGMNHLGKPLIIMGLILVVAGLLISFAPRLPAWLGRLPGDISIKRENFSFYFPLTTCLLLSALLSFLLWLFRK